MNRETITLLLTLISVIVAVATPEVRCYLGLQETCLVRKPTPPPPPVPTPVPVSPPSPKPVPLPAPPTDLGNISDIFNPERDKFEKTSDFQARREQLLTKFNQASSQGDVRYQAGMVHRTHPTQ